VTETFVPEKFHVKDWMQACGLMPSDTGWMETFNWLIEEGYDPNEVEIVLNIVCREIRHDNPDRAITYMRGLCGQRNETVTLRALATLCSHGMLYFPNSCSISPICLQGLRDDAERIAELHRAKIADRARKQREARKAALKAKKDAKAAQVRRQRVQERYGL
jgi:hypothetical protein